QKQPLFAAVAVVPPAPKKSDVAGEKAPQASKASLESIFKRLHTSVKGLKSVGASAKGGASKSVGKKEAKEAVASAKKKTGKK
ncbi:MAG: hypothetical protein V1817_00705, partial [Candidatus Micrarchaeota archaeon]